MTKDVLISISGMQAADGENSDVEMITAGNYYLKDGKHYILYDEALEGMDGVIKNTIKISPVSLDIIKRGLSNVHMTFEKGKKTQTRYVTPFGEMMVGIHTSSIEVEEEENNLRVHVDYSLDINYERISDCNIVVDIKSRIGAAFSLK